MKETPDKANSQIRMKKTLISVLCNFNPVKNICTESAIKTLEGGVKYGQSTPEHWLEFFTFLNMPEKRWKLLNKILKNFLHRHFSL